MVQNKTIYDEITDLLDNNGKLDPELRGRYTLIALRNIGRDIEELKGLKPRVTALERVSIIMFMQLHPKWTAFIIVAIFMLLNAWFVSDFRHTILQVLGLPKDLLP